MQRCRDFPDNAQLFSAHIAVSRRLRGSVVMDRTGRVNARLHPRFRSVSDLRCVPGFERRDSSLDTGMAALLALLTAVDAGLGAVFFGVFDQAKLRQTFGIPEDYTAVGVVAVGYARPQDRPSPSLKRGHRAVADVVRRGRWS